MAFYNINIVRFYFRYSGTMLIRWACVVWVCMAIECKPANNLSQMQWPINTFYSIRYKLLFISFEFIQGLFSFLFYYYHIVFYEFPISEWAEHSIYVIHFSHHHQISILNSIFPTFVIWSNSFLCLVCKLFVFFFLSFAVKFNLVAGFSAICDSLLFLPPFVFLINPTIKHKKKKHGN